MVVLTRKQREIERRTAAILAVAKPILVREGFHALSMDRVAAEMEYAKGTIYNHFPHKEEIVLALAVRSMELRRKLFEFSASFGKKSRRRMMAIGAACEFYTHHCHDDFVIEQWVRNGSVWDKASHQRQNLVRQCEAQCISIVSAIVQDGVDEGSLVVPSGMTNEELVFGFWAITFGSQVLTASSPSLSALGIRDPKQALRIHCATLLNGFGWRPISTLTKYLAQSEKLAQSLMPRLHLLRDQHQHP